MGDDRCAGPSSITSPWPAAIDHLSAGAAGSPSNGRYAGSCSTIARPHTTRSVPGTSTSATVVLVDELHLDAAARRVEAVMRGALVERVVVARDDDDRAVERVELVGGPRQRGVGHARAVEQVADDEHRVDLLGACKRQRVGERALFTTVARRKHPGTEMAVRRVQARLRDDGGPQQSRARG